MADLTNKDNPGYTPDRSGTHIPRSDTKVGEVSSSTQTQFLNFLTADFIRGRSEVYTDFQYRVEAARLFIADRHTVSSDQAEEKFDVIERIYFLKEGSEFKRGAYIRFSKSLDAGSYEIDEIGKNIEGQRANLEFPEEGRLTIGLHSPGMNIGILIADNRVYSIISHLHDNEEDEKGDEINLEHLKVGSRRLTSDDGDILEAEYDSETDSIKITAAKGEQKKRILRIPVNIDVDEVAEKFFPAMSLNDPYNVDPTDDNWYYSDLQKLAGIREEPSMPEGNIKL